MGERNDGETAGHGLLPMIMGCGLMLVAVLALGLVGPGWGIAILVAALLVCPVLMLGPWRMAEGGKRTLPARRDQHGRNG